MKGAVTRSPRAAPSPVTVVLVRTHSPGNLGAAARAAANFGARLALVDPRVPLDHPDIAAHASGAEPRLDRMTDSAEVSSRYDLAVALTSTRGRSAGSLPPRATVAALRRASAAGRSVALVFGPERSGLRTEEVLDCDACWSLPTVPTFPTLNLAQAVAVALALLRGARGSSPGDPVGSPVAPRTRRRLLEEARAVLETRFPTRRARPDVIDELLAPLRRAVLTQREAELLLAALARPGRSK